MNDKKIKVSESLILLLIAMLKEYKNNPDDKLIDDAINTLQALLDRGY